jgi:hypothetical protein
MQVLINISDNTVKDLITLQEVERGRVGNYTRVEPIVDACRYSIADKIMTLIMDDLNYQLGVKPVLHTYDKK